MTVNVLLYWLQLQFDDNYDLQRFCQSRKWKTTDEKGAEILKGCLDIWNSLKQSGADDDGDNEVISILAAFNLYITLVLIILLLLLLLMID